MTDAAGMRFGLWVIAALLAVECRGERMVLDGVAAHANRHVVTISQVHAAAAPLRQQLVARHTGSELRTRLQQAYQQALDGLIDRYLILDAYEALGQKLPEWVVERRVKEIVDEAFGGDRDKLMAELSRDSLTFDEWKKEIGNQLAVAYLRRSRVDELVQISPTAVRSAFDEGQTGFARPEKVKLRLIMLRAESAEADAATGALAARVRERAVGGEDFGALAREFSRDAKAADGGDWGWIEPKILRAELTRAIAGLAAGRISEVVAVDGERYILKVEERQAAGAAAFSEVQSEIEQRIRREETERLYRAWTGVLRQQAYVKVFPVEWF